MDGVGRRTQGAGGLMQSWLGDSILIQLLSSYKWLISYHIILGGDTDTQNYCQDLSSTDPVTEQKDLHVLEWW